MYARAFYGLHYVSGEYSELRVWGVAPGKDEDCSVETEVMQQEKWGDKAGKGLRTWMVWYG